MKKMVLAVAAVFLLIGINVFAADGDLIVNGNIKTSGITYTDGSGGLTPTGAMMAWPAETVPAGWLELNGAAISRTTYAALFAAIGTKYGVGDGSTTFNLPDMRGRFLRGWAHGQTTDPDKASRADRGDGTSGDNVGTKQGDEFKSHSHSTSLAAYYFLFINPGGPYVYNSGPNPAGYGQLSIGSTGGNETRPININVMWIIKY